MAQSYALIGIGRQNNFVESFTVATFVEGKRVLRAWTPIIPKSILFVITNESNSEQNWNLELLVKPTTRIPLILVGEGIFLLILGLVIIILHLGEKVDDKREGEKLPFHYM